MSCYARTFFNPIACSLVHVGLPIDEIIVMGTDLHAHTFTSLTLSVGGNAWHIPLGLTPGGFDIIMGTF